MSEIILMGEPMAMFKADYAGKLEEIDKFTRSLAGAEVNVAIGLKRLGFEVAYVTKLGADPFGKYIKNTLNAEGINTNYIAHDPEHPTGFQLKNKTDAGDPEVVYFRKGSAASHMGISEIDRIDMRNVRSVHITGIPPALSDSCRAATFKLIHSAREMGLPVTFDPNLRPVLWKSRDEMISVINELASMCDVILPGIKEGQTLTGFNDAQGIAEFYLKLGVNTVVIKNGAEGAYVRTGTEAFAVPGFKVDRVVDTVGAGDGFAVGVISGLLDKLPLRDAVIRGNAIGAMQVMVPGDNEGLPNREQLRQFLEKRS